MKHQRRSAFTFTSSIARLTDQPERLERFQVRKIALLAVVKEHVINRDVSEGLRERRDHFCAEPDDDLDPVVRLRR